MIEREGLEMVYDLHKFKHYLLGAHFKMYTDHYTLGYLMKKPVFWGRIHRWLLLFHKCDFEVIMKPGKPNVGLDYLSWILTVGILDDRLPNAQ
jgi:hypothetical protein